MLLRTFVTNASPPEQLCQDRGFDKFSALSRCAGSRSPSPVWHTLGPFNGWKVGGINENRSALKDLEWLGIEPDAMVSRPKVERYEGISSTR